MSTLLNFSSNPKQFANNIILGKDDATNIKFECKYVKPENGI